MIVPFYAALFGLLFVALSVRALRLRRRLQVPLGSGGHPLLLKATRVHANFAEYVPLALLLLFLLEQRGAPVWLLHGLCAALLIGRAAHAWGVSQARENYRFRVVGMVCTLAILVVAALAMLQSYVAR